MGKINQGDRFARWTALETQRVQQGKKIVTKWLCRCDCGTEKLVNGHDLNRGKSTQCINCYGRAQKNLIGQIWGNWTVLDWAPKKFRRAYWKCKCKCGSIYDVCQQTLLNGASVKCVHCNINESVKKHGYTCKDNKRPLYSLWMTFFSRCYNPKNRQYHNYGGRGIKVCDRWFMLENFEEDMGERPSLKHSIDRIDNNKGYSPENCRWATQLEQANNTRRNIYYEKNGLKLSSFEWSKIFKVSEDACSKLIWRRGFDHAYDFYTTKTKRASG